MDYTVIPKDVKAMTNEELNAEWQLLVPAHCRIHAIEEELWRRHHELHNGSK